MKKMSEILYKDLELPNYINSREVFLGLNVIDLIRACAVGGVNLILPGTSGTGKTQAANDIYYNWFGGNIADGGQGIRIDADAEMDVKMDVFTRFNMTAGIKEVKNKNALIYFINEINRAPTPKQNQLLGIGEGSVELNGSHIRLGRDGYMWLIATRNPKENGNVGTFEQDDALDSRLHVAIDLDYQLYKPTIEDRREISKRKANPNVKEAPIRDISDKILRANKIISGLTTDLGVEAEAVLNYLKFGLENCQLKAKKGKKWYVPCQDCSFNSTNQSLCSMIKEPVPRTEEALRKYAASLQFVAKLKNPNVKIDAVELMFRAFELTGAYQHLLNPQLLATSYDNQNPIMMREVTDKLMEDFRQNEDFIISSLSEAKKGNKVTTFFRFKNQLGNWENVKDNEDLVSRVSKEEPYTDKREIGLGWVPEIVDLEIKDSKK